MLIQARKTENIQNRYLNGKYRSISFIGVGDNNLWLEK